MKQQQDKCMVLHTLSVPASATWRYRILAALPWGLLHRLHGLRNCFWLNHPSREPFVEVSWILSGGMFALEKADWSATRRRKFPSYLGLRCTACSRSSAACSARAPWCRLGLWSATCSRSSGAGDARAPWCRLAVGLQANLGQSSWCLWCCSSRSASRRDLRNHRSWRCPHWWAW